MSQFCTLGNSVRFRARAPNPSCSLRRENDVGHDIDIGSRPIGWALIYLIKCPGGETVDAPDLDSGAERRGGSSPLPGTILILDIVYYDVSISETEGIAVMIV